MASGCRGRAAPGICREQQQWWGEILPRKPRATAPACAASPGTVGAEGQHRGTPMSQEWLQGFPYCPSSSWLAWKPLAFLSSTLIPDFHPWSRCRVTAAGSSTSSRFAVPGMISLSLLGISGSCNSCGCFHNRPTQIGSVLVLRCLLKGKKQSNTDVSGRFGVTELGGRRSGFVCLSLH